MWEKLQNIDRRIIYALMIVTIAAVLIKPVGLAIYPSEETQKVYDFMEQLPAGSIVYLGVEFSGTGMSELMPAVQAVIRHGFSKDLRFIAAGANRMAGDMADAAFSLVDQEFPDKEYGVDWVNIGYKPGETVFLEKMLESVMDATVGVDFYGNPLTSFPLMEDFPTLKEADAVIVFPVGIPGEREYIKHVTGPNNIPMAAASLSVNVTQVMPLLQAGQMVGAMLGTKGAAEYEVLIGQPGNAVAGLDAQSFSNLLIIGLMILGNIGYFVTKKDKSHSNSGFKG